MIVEKPAWVSHGVLPIFSIDIQPGGQRFATAGGDHKVRIWHMLDLSKETEPDGSALTLLATIRDHFGSVNCVRWAKHGRHIASGSDDKVIHIHEKKPGSGTTEFGSGEPPDVENWKLVTTLRGHTADVVDLNWSPDDSMVASCSLDNTIHIWSMTDASTLAVLRGHTSLVKGISWDPIGSFLASQSDDKSVIIWRTSDWSLEHKTEGHWGKTVGSTFFRRLGWSPCGHFITTTHGFQKPHHSAPVLERGDWSATFDFLGHNAPVIAVKFNHSMFRKHHRNGSEPADLQHIASNERANGAVKSVAKDMIPYNVIAMGSQDCSVTVWTTASPRPIFVGKHFFQQSIVDLSWSPDGYSLFCCSLDGTIAAFHFQAKELGYRISDSELDELKRSRYGDVRGRQTSLAESPAQLLLEAAAAKQFGSKKLINSSLRSNLSGKVQATDGTSVGKHVPTKISDGEVVENNRVSNTLPVSSKMAPPKVHSPVKQKEYRRPDGRKRIIPEAVGVPVHQEHGSEGKSQPPHDAVIPNPSARNNDQVFASAEDKTWENGQKNGQKRPLPYTGNEYPNKLCNTETETTVGTTARAGNVDSLTLEVCRNSAPKTAKGSFSQTEAITVFSSERAKPLLSIHVNDAGSGSESVPTSLEAKPSSSINFMETSSATQPKETELICYKGSTIQWQDKLSGKAAVLTGNCNFWAVGCEDGTLQVYTKCGRRALPTMMVGSTPIFIDCDNGWKLLVVTQKGLIYVWDLFNWSCLLEDSLAPLVNTTVDSTSKDYGMIKVISAKFSRTGAPLVVLATRHAFLFHMTMKCWLRVADDCFPASNFSSSWPVLSGQGGELATLQADVGMFSMRNISWNRAMSEDATQTRAHLEAQLASALALRSPIEYRLHLLSYARCLTRETDEVRLREVCESLLGPPIGMIASSSSDAIKSSWDPFILGMKKHDLLKEVVLPAMASNRKVQRLLNEFVDLLSEYASKDPEEQAEKIDALDGNAI